MGNLSMWNRLVLICVALLSLSNRCRVHCKTRISAPEARKESILIYKGELNDSSYIIPSESATLNRRAYRSTEIQENIEYKKLQIQQTVTPLCADSGKWFCSRVKNYPANLINEFLSSEAKKYDELFGVDILAEVTPTIADRFAGIEEESLCTSFAKIIYPQAGLTKDNSWNFIVNQANYTQGLRIEECVGPGKSCAMSESFPSIYTTECRQKFIYRQLVGVTPDGKVAKNLFQLPSCCVCILKSKTSGGKK